MFSNFLVLDNLIDKVVENELRNPFLRCLYFYTSCTFINFSFAFIPVVVRLFPPPRLFGTLK